MTKTNIEQESPDLTGLLSDINDNSGLAEIQAAIDQINKIENRDANENEEKDVDAQANETETEQEIDKPVENTEEEEVKKEKKSLSDKDKLRKLQNDKYRALAEKEEAMQQVEQLRKLLDESLNSGTYHYSQNAQLALDKAKEAKKRALEEGDTEALIESDIAMTKALSAINELERWNTESQTKQSVQPQSKPLYDYNETNKAIASDWLDGHSYLQPHSKDYNKELATQVASFVHHLDNDLERKGLQNIYFSDEYFDTIDKYITSINHPLQKTHRNSESSAHIGAVRNSYNYTGNSKPAKTQITLTPEERIMAANAGLSEKEWLKYKLEDLKTGRKI
jgi:hypothetical protein